MQSKDNSSSNNSSNTNGGSDNSRMHRGRTESWTVNTPSTIEKLIARPKRTPKEKKWKQFVFEFDANDHNNNHVVTHHLHHNHTHTHLSSSPPTPSNTFATDLTVSYNGLTSPRRAAASMAESLWSFSLSSTTSSSSTTSTTSSVSSYSSSSSPRGLSPPPPSSSSPFTTTEPYSATPGSPVFPFPSQHQNTQETVTTRTMGYVEPSKKRRSLSPTSSHLTRPGTGPSTEAFATPDNPMFWPHTLDTGVIPPLPPPQQPQSSSPQSFSPSSSSPSSPPVQAVTFSPGTATQGVQFVYHNHSSGSKQPRARSKDLSAGVAGGYAEALSPAEEGSSPRALDILYILN